jgi:hypothetical protein
MGEWKELTEGELLGCVSTSRCRKNMNIFRWSVLFGMDVPSDDLDCVYKAISEALRAKNSGEQA